MNDPVLKCLGLAAACLLAAASLAAAVLAAEGNGWHQSLTKGSCISDTPESGRIWLQCMAAVATSAQHAEQRWCATSGDLPCWPGPVC